MVGKVEFMMVGVVAVVLVVGVGAVTDSSGGSY